jgi:hypothetical protein
MKKGTTRSVNKSQLIRDFAAANPTLGQSQIVRALSDQGHKVYAAIVAQALRGTASAKKGTSKRGRKPGSKNKAKSSSTILDLATIKAVAAFVKSQGSVEAALSSIQQYQMLANLLK